MQIDKNGKGGGNNNNKGQNQNQKQKGGGGGNSNQLQSLRSRLKRINQRLHSASIRYQLTGAEEPKQKPHQTRRSEHGYQPDSSPTASASPPQIASRRPTASVNCQHRSSYRVTSSSTMSKATVSSDRSGPPTRDPTRNKICHVIREGKRQGGKVSRAWLERNR